MFSHTLVSIQKSTFAASQSSHWSQVLLEEWILCIVCWVRQGISLPQHTNQLVADSWISDHISQTQIDDVSSAVTNAGSGDQGIVGRLRNLFLQLPGQGRRGGQSDRDISAERDLASELDQLENDRVNHQNQMQSGQLNLDSLSAEEIARRIYPVFKFRDRVMKSIEGGMDKVSSVHAHILSIIDRVNRSLG